MKKTCGALVIGLLITTNVYAKETKVSACKDPYIASFISKTGIKLSEKQCKVLSEEFHAAFDDGFNDGAEHGIAVANDGFQPKQKQVNCPPCDCSYNVPLQNNDIKRQQELDDARREQYYLDQNMNRHR